MFTLAISYLTTSNLPWFMDLTFQVPMQYCSLQHQTLLPSLVTSITVCCFCFGSISSFFPELFLHWFPVAFWAPTDLGSSSFSVLSFCLFILFMGLSRQEYWSGLRPEKTSTFALLKFPFKNSCPWSAKRSWFFGALILCLPRTAAFLNKAIFNFTTNFSLSIGFLNNEQLKPEFNNKNKYFTTEYLPF